MPLESSDEVDLIKRSVRLDPKKIKDHLKSAGEEWPENTPLPEPEGG